MKDRSRAFKETANDDHRSLSFLNLAGYFRWFVEGFFKLALPLTLVTQKNIKFSWTLAYEESFQEFKKRLTTAAVLTPLLEPLDLRFIATIRSKG